MFVNPNVKLLDLNNVFDISNAKVDRLKIYTSLRKLSLDNIFTMILDAYRDNRNYGMCISKPSAKSIYIYIYTYKGRHCNYSNIADKIPISESMMDIQGYKDLFTVEKNTQ